MTSYEFGDVVLVAVSFTNGSGSKQRPAVIVSSPLFNAEHHDRIILPISSQARSTYETEWMLQNWKRAGLMGPSVLKPALTTLELSLIRRKLGHLGPSDLNALRELLKKILVLSEEPTKS